MEGGAAWFGDPFERIGGLSTEKAIASRCGWEVRRGTMLELESVIGIAGTASEKDDAFLVVFWWLPAVSGCFLAVPE